MATPSFKDADPTGRSSASEIRPRVRYDGNRNLLRIRRLWLGPADSLTKKVKRQFSTSYHCYSSFPRKRRATIARCVKTEFILSQI